MAREHLITVSSWASRSRSTNLRFSFLVKVASVKRSAGRPLVVLPAVKLGPGPPGAREIHGAADTLRFAVPHCRRTACHLLLPGAGLHAPRDARRVTRTVPRRWAAGARGCPPERYQASHSDARQLVAKLWRCAALVASLQVLVATRERRPAVMPNVRHCRQACDPCMSLA